MRLHTDRIDRIDLAAAASIARVGFFKLEERGSRCRAHAFEVRLEGYVGKRQLNFGDGYTTAATWDEWGIFFDRLFKMDEHMVAGSAASTGWGYRGRADFRTATGYRYDHLEHEEQHVYHKWGWFGEHGVNECECGAQMVRQRPKILVTPTRDGRPGECINLDEFKATEQFLDTAVPA
jgi:hypothetical protein